MPELPLILKTVEYIYIVLDMFIKAVNVISFILSLLETLKARMLKFWILVLSIFLKPMVSIHVKSRF